VSLPCPVATCHRDMPGTATICGACSAELGRALQSVAWLAEQLDVTLSRQTSKTGGGRSAETPLPFDPRASEAAYVLRSTLAAWTRVLAEQTGDPRPEDSCESMAAWLSERLSWLVRHPEATEAHGEILAAVRDAQRTVDRPAERAFAGWCDCGAALYARPGAPLVKCRHCDADPYQVATLREQMLQQAEDVLATATEIARAATRLGHPVTPAAIRGYAHRGRIIPHGEDGHGRPMYRVGDILELLAQQAQRDGRLTRSPA